ncbi:hypothetical protein BOTNAR_0002g00590 [Botryotinia narcissicola]|uniref:SNF2 N-terminal domain-containing protein n=1 Tax=Botryotinia narcissicola TaxID=278944 RepID=A0A4Z1J973_9HELO|nr:hypothetical protein BOTNAR_0002g00590 [Botryotinia narcissicola]
MQQDADDLTTVNDPNWVYNLEGLFDPITVDEAHTLKNYDTMVHRTVTWLSRKFTILAMATVLSNHVEDFRGYKKVFETTGNN